MRHRHLRHQEFTLAAIDDIISRGKARDWARMRKVCRPRLRDPYAQRYHFWKHYAETLPA